MQTDEAAPKHRVRIVVWLALATLLTATTAAASQPDCRPSFVYVERDGRALITAVLGGRLLADGNQPLWCGELGQETSRWSRYHP